MIWLWRAETSLPALQTPAASVHAGSIEWTTSKNTLQGEQE